VPSPAVLCDLSFLAHQIERLLANDRRQQDDLAVITAMLQRIDHTQAAMLEELRTIHQWMNGTNERLRRLEDENTELGRS
jgi:hypothetical protein